MTTNNSSNTSNIHFQNTSGTLEVADRLRVSTTGYTFNLGMTLAAGTFSITGADGTALSATNPAYVILQDRSSPGLNKIFTVTANQTFIDDAGASTIIGNLFGYTTSVAITNDVPFFLYAVSNDAEDTILFTISRVPHRSVAPAVGTFGKTGSAVADTQGSFFALGDPTVADYDSNPCTCIGSFRMRMSAADDWTVQALASSDGVGQFNESTEFEVPRGQFTAASGKYFLNNGGTAPDDSNGKYWYCVSKGGNILIKLTYQSVTTAGIGAVTAIICAPLVVSTAINSQIFILSGSAAFSGNISFLAGIFDGGLSYSLAYINALGAGGLNNNSFQIGDIYRVTGEYKASIA